MVFPKPFITQPSAIASFDHQDIASAVGIENYFALSGSQGWFLSSQEDYSEQIEFASGAGGGRFTVTFDSGVFNLPRIIRGTATISFGYGTAFNDNVSASGAVFLVRNSVETALGELKETREFLDSAEKMAYFEIDMSRTLVKKGDNLRLRMTLGKTGGGGIAQFGIDPKNRDGVVITAANDVSTVLKLGIPFEVDV